MTWNTVGSPSRVLLLPRRKSQLAASVSLVCVSSPSLKLISLCNKVRAEQASVPPPKG